MRGWYEEYADDGLEIIGVHTPEFKYEYDVNNVRQATVDLGVSWPVAIDNEWETWRAYNNRYWPAMYLVDKAGNIRYVHIGEGRYERTEAVIQAAIGGLGVAYVPSYAVQKDIARGDLAVVETEFDPYSMVVSAMYLGRRHQSAKTRAFISYLEAWLGRQTV